MLITHLLTNMVVVQMGLIHTNTPAFQEYERQKLLNDAQTVGVRWHLDTNLIDADRITESSAEAHIRGPFEHIVFAKRYEFWSGNGTFFGFADQSYCWPTDSGRHFVERYTQSNFYSEDAELVQQWAHSTNHLTMKKAQQIAEAGLRSSGVPLEKMKLKSPKSKEQVHWKLRDGTSCVLPYYRFDWMPREDAALKRCRIDVSGISSNIVLFNCGSSEFYEAPTNYFQMVGISSNTIFVVPIKQPGQKEPLYRPYPFQIPLGKDHSDILY